MQNQRGMIVCHRVQFQDLMMMGDNEVQSKKGIITVTEKKNRNREEKQRSGRNTNEKVLPVLYLDQCKCNHLV